jgi:hypothetical protein
MTFNRLLPLGAAIATLALGGTALAQQTNGQGQTGGQSSSSGTTSGPAAGTNVQPSAVTQKQAGTHNAGAVAAGAPGAPAEKGSESGEKPRR